MLCKLIKNAIKRIILKGYVCVLHFSSNNIFLSSENCLPVYCEEKKKRQNMRISAMMCAKGNSTAQVFYFRKKG